jgi:hypothetical protein
MYVKPSPEEGQKKAVYPPRIRGLETRKVLFPSVFDMCFSPVLFLRLSQQGEFKKSMSKPFYKLQTPPSFFPAAPRWRPLRGL